MSFPLDSDVQEDVRTFPMYQRLSQNKPLCILLSDHTETDAI